MKASSVIFCLIFGLLFSCKKSNNSNNTSDPNVLQSPYYLSATMNGSKINFNYKVTCVIPTGGDTIIDGKHIASSNFVIDSYLDSKLNTELKVILTGNSSFKLATITYDYPGFSIAPFYAPDLNSINTTAYWGGQEADILRDGNQFSTNFQLVITSIDQEKNTIKGSFSGNLIGRNLTTGKIGTLSVSDGSFFLPTTFY